MAFIKTPVKGMNDFLPSDMRLREYVISVIKETYGNFGFARLRLPLLSILKIFKASRAAKTKS